MEKGVAFLVGLDTYKDPNLDNFVNSPTPTEDIRRLKAILNHKYSQYTSQVVLVEPTDLKDLQRQLEAFLSEEEYKNILIYFSGHGYQLLNKNEAKYEGYLATHESEIKFEDGLIVREYNGLAFTYLNRLISKARHLNSLVLCIDACHSSLAIEDKVMRVALSTLDSRSRYCLLASSLKFENSYSSVFTETLIRILQNEKIGRITADMLVKHLRENVSDSRQHLADLCSGASLIELMNYPSINKESVKIEPIRKDGNILCPYQGLKAFKDSCDQQEFFFGRDREIQRLRGQLDHCSFITVVGASGSGKSSKSSCAMSQKDGKYYQGSNQVNIHWEVCGQQY
jgi:hypothetical protein